MKGAGAGVNSKPKRVAYRPVRIEAREGAQVAFPAYACVNVTPAVAIESMLGVASAPPATPPPPKVTSL
jgi:hypothetical protein